jgi:hypothetical protein
MHGAVIAGEKPMAERIKRALDGFYTFVDNPLYLWTRPVLVLLLVPLVIGLTQPLWHIVMEAPQYPNGLSLDIYAHTIKGGHDGADISEINILNYGTTDATLQLRWYPRPGEGTDFGF